MKPTNKLRWLIKAAYAPPVLQQWWEGFRNDTAINYAHPDAHRLNKNLPGEWRDVPTESE